MAENKNTAAKGSSQKKANTPARKKTVRKPEAKPGTKTVKEEITEVDPKILAELQKQIDNSMKEAEAAVKDAVNNTSQKSDYSE